MSNHRSEVEKLKKSKGTALTFINIWDFIINFRGIIIQYVVWVDKEIIQHIV